MARAEAPQPRAPQPGETPPIPGLLPTQKRSPVVPLLLTAAVGLSSYLITGEIIKAVSNGGARPDATPGISGPVTPGTTSHGSETGTAKPFQSDTSPTTIPIFDCTQAPETIAGPAQAGDLPKQLNNDATHATIINTGASNATLTIKTATGNEATLIGSQARPFIVEATSPIEVAGLQPGETVQTECFVAKTPQDVDAEVAKIVTPSKTDGKAQGTLIAKVGTDGIIHEELDSAA